LVVEVVLEEVVLVGVVLVEEGGEVLEVVGGVVLEVVETLEQLYQEAGHTLLDQATSKHL
jgi:hypothetical protein